jgi:hypothetical protein
MGALNAPIFSLIGATYFLREPRRDLLGASLDFLSVDF